jgi:hypothetical protein
MDYFKMEFATRYFRAKEEKIAQEKEKVRKRSEEEERLRHEAATRRPLDPAEEDVRANFGIG